MERISHTTSRTAKQFKRKKLLLSWPMESLMVLFRKLNSSGEPSDKANEDNSFSASAQRQIGAPEGPGAVGFGLIEVELSSETLRRILNLPPAHSVPM